MSIAIDTFLYLIESVSNIECKCGGDQDDFQ